MSDRVNEVERLVVVDRIGESNSRGAGLDICGGRCRRGSCASSWCCGRSGCLDVTKGDVGYPETCIACILGDVLDDFVLVDILLALGNELCGAVNGC